MKQTSKLSITKNSKIDEKVIEWAIKAKQAIGLFVSFLRHPLFIGSVR
ncbi:hypothetical protein [Isobaculum melis]|uniref:Uncharacterized protein n=1 Tax=Isobaculum melis TaxID=142588 RepID=A0A1H9RLU1_9LACT|nr:hypothetical protein [Isobaculum melis]SER73732.1 hypothetical protein SAMN04488559_104153 [Isobaculum melis]